MMIDGAAHIGEESQADEWTTAVVKFPSDITANLSCGIQVAVDPALRILGSAGYTIVPTPWFPGDGRFGSDEKSTHILLYHARVPNLARYEELYALIWET